MNGISSFWRLNILFSDGKNRKVSGGSFSGKGREAAQRGSVRDGKARLRMARLRVGEGEAAVLSEGVSSVMTERECFPLFPPAVDVRGQRYPAIREPRGRSRRIFL